MREFAIQTELWLPRPRCEVFPFFAEARNLETLTPPWLKFEVLTPAPIAMRPGTLIDYRIRVHGLPIRLILEEDFAVEPVVDPWLAAFRRKPLMQTWAATNPAPIRRYTRQPCGVSLSMDG